MKKIIAVLALLVCASAIGAPYDMIFMQRNPTDTGNMPRQLSVPGSNSLLQFDPSTLLPVWTPLGTGLTITGGALSMSSTLVNTDWNSVSGLSQLLNKPTLATVATTGSYPDLINKPTITPFAFGSPNVRTVSLATAYQATDPSKASVVTVTLQAQSAISLTGANNNEGTIVLGSTSAVASGTGTTIANYKNNLGGGLVVGLNLNIQTAQTYTIAMPAGWYFAVRQTTGTGLAVVSAFDQAAN